MPATTGTSASQLKLLLQALGSISTRSAKLSAGMPQLSANVLSRGIRVPRGLGSKLGRCDLP